MHEEILVCAKGLDGQVELLSDRVRIRRHGQRLGDPGRASEIPLAAITAVHCQSPGLIADGYLQLTLVVAEASPLAKAEGMVFHASHQAELQRLQAAIRAQYKVAMGASLL